MIRDRDQEVRPDEHVELGRVQPADGLIEDREVQDDEQVVVVLVDLRALVAREDVLVVERVELEVLLEPGALRGARALDVDPAKPAPLDGLDLGLGASSRRAESTRARAERLRRGFGRLGIGSEGVVQHVHVSHSTSRWWYPAALHSRCIERGGGTWPCETPATTRRTARPQGKVPIPSRCDRAPEQGLRHSTGGGFLHRRGFNASSGAQVQGM